MRKFWLVFAQTATIVFAGLYLVSLFRGETPPPRGDVVTVREAAPGPAAGAGAASYNTAARQAISAVVNIYTTKQVSQRPLSRDELLLRRFFGEPPAEHDAKVRGVRIMGVQRGGPAELAGIRPGDVVVAVNGKPIPDTGALINETAALAPGTRGTFGVLRDSKPLSIPVEVGRRPPPARTGQAMPR